MCQGGKSTRKSTHKAASSPDPADGAESGSGGQAEAGTADGLCQGAAEVPGQCYEQVGTCHRAWKSLREEGQEEALGGWGGQDPASCTSV